MIFVLRYWIPVVFISVLTGDCVHVTVKDDKKFAMLFSPVVLQCHYNTHSVNPPVVQWLYKSYCTDRTRESFTFSETLGVHGSKLGPKSHLDCSDESRTVQTVASKQGNSLNLAKQYKGRDITIINKADLRIGELHWGDSGVYVCQVFSGDDLEGRNEGQVELLVLGKTGVQNDVLPEFELEIMPEWVFVASVGLGSILFLMVLGVCWCQCCPHSCCCYVRCCCCPDTCCCPKHLYEAGKKAKSGQPTQIAIYPPYYGIPMLPQAAPCMIEPKMQAVPPSVENNTARAGSVSELSSLHDGDVDFRQTYKQVQKKALPPISDPSNEPQIHTASTAHRLRPTHYQRNGTEEQHESRWSCRSEHLPRKAFDTRGRTGSLDELEEFARNYGHRAGRRGDLHELRDPERDFDMEIRRQNQYRPRGFRGDGYDDDDDDSNWRRCSPTLTTQRRNDTSNEQYATRRKSYNDAYLTAVLERKARRQGECPGRVDEDSDTPSKSSKKSSDCYYSRSPSNRPEEDDSLPPYCEVVRSRTEEPMQQEHCRTMEPATRPFSYTRPNQSMAHTLQQLREDKNRPRKLTTHLSRDSLIV